MKCEEKQKEMNQRAFCWAHVFYNIPSHNIYPKDGRQPTVYTQPPSKTYCTSLPRLPKGILVIPQ